MKWSVIVILVMACQVDSPDSSVVQGSRDSVRAVSIVAENSFARIKITSDEPLMANEQGMLRIEFTALKNLQAKTRRITHDGSGQSPSDQLPTYQQRPTIKLRYDNPQPIHQPDLVTLEADDDNQHIFDASTKQITLNDMEANDTFTLNYQVNAKSSFFINAKIDVGGVEEKFEFFRGNYEYGYSNLEIEVGGTYTPTIEPDDYATVEITKDVAQVNGKPKPAVRIKVTPKEKAKEIETIETVFKNTNYFARKQAECSGVGYKACGTATTLTDSFAGGNGITILHPIEPNKNDSTGATIEVKFHLAGRKEVVAGEERVSWTSEQAFTILASETGAPSSPSAQGGSSGVLAYRHSTNGMVASLQFIVTKPADRSDGLGLLRVVFNAYQAAGGWTGLESGARLHLRLPFLHAYAGKSSSSSNLVKHVKYDNETATLYENKETGERNWEWSPVIERKYEIKFNKIEHGQSVKLDFLVAGNVGLAELRASMDLKESSGDKFNKFGDSLEHSVDFTGGCGNKTQKRERFQEITKDGSEAGKMSASITGHNPIRVDHSSTIKINNTNFLRLATRGERDILVDVWGTAGEDTTRGRPTVTFGANEDRAKSVGIKKVGNHHYHRYRIKPSSSMYSGELDLRINVRPRRDGEFKVILTNVKEGRDSGSRMASFNFRVAPRRSCLFDS